MNFSLMEKFREFAAGVRRYTAEVNSAYGARQFMSSKKRCIGTEKPLNLAKRTP